MTLKGHLQEIGRLSTLNYNDYTTFKFSFPFRVLILWYQWIIKATENGSI